MTFIVAGILAFAPNPHPGCPKTFTYHMDTRAAVAVYQFNHVSQSNTRMLARIARCQRVHDNKQRAARFNRSQRALWHQRQLDANMSHAVASWYNIDGTGSCGVGSVQAGYRFASLILRCGAVIRICHIGCVDATMSDHGPYVSGRTFDLNVNLRDAISCSDICDVRWRDIGN